MTRFAITCLGDEHAGRLVFRVAWDNPEAYNIVTLNDIAPAESIAYLIQYDSIHGTWKCDVECGDDGTITVTEGDRVQKIKFTQEKDITKVCWSHLRCSRTCNVLLGGLGVVVALGG